MSASGRVAILIRLAAEDADILRKLVEQDQVQELQRTPPFATVREISAAETIRRVIRGEHERRTGK